MRFRIAAGTEMTPKLLSEYITKHKKIVRSRYQRLQDAYENKYEIYSAPKKTDGKPDNRVSVNYAKYIVDTFNGFFCGIPVKVSVNEGQRESEAAEYLNFLHQYNDQENNDAELAKLVDIHGSAHEMYYNDENGEVGIVYLSPMESFFLVDDSILEREMYFVRYYTDPNRIERGSFSDATSVQHFYRRGGYHWDGEAAPHFFGGVPASEFTANDEGMGLFESALPAINQYNKALSEKANDVDYFADAYIKVLGPKLNKDEVSFLRRTRVINFTGNRESFPEVDFMQKPNADSTQENLLDRLKEEIFIQSMVANISDENFGTVSGVALRYRLLAMTNLFRAKERRFTSAMNRRYRLVFSNPIAGTHGVREDDWMNLEYHFTPNYPANISDEAETVSKLNGIVSEETQLKILSIVDDPKKEIERIEQEEKTQQENILDRVIGSRRTGGGFDGE